MKILHRILSDEGWAVDGFSDPRLAVEALRKKTPEVVLTDMRMPGLTGLDVIRATKEADPTTSIVVCTAYGTMEGAVDAMKAGACDYVSKPFQSDELLMTLDNALERTRLARENEVLTTQVARGGAEKGLGDGDIVGSSRVLKAALELADKAAQSAVPVLLLGESGTGKELFARRIHRRSPRKTGRFVPINCSSIPEALMESELFGHEKGAFTGAERTKLGLMELASGGTLFLDEIGEMPASLQSKLLRALQEQEVQRVGGLHPIPVDVRVVAATHRDPHRMAEAGTFRSDLLYRLDVLRIELPALRDRPGDVGELLSAFLADCAQRAGRAALTISPEVLRIVETWSWPGNVRELRNFAERLTALVEGEEVRVQDLPREMRGVSQAIRFSALDPAPGPAEPESLDYRRAKERFEKEWLEGILKAAQGNMTTAAKLAGLSRRHMYEKLEKLGVKLTEEKPEE